MKSEVTSFASPQEMNSKILTSPSDIPNLVSPNQSSGSTASLKSEIQVAIVFLINLYYLILTKGFLYCTK